MPGSFQTSLKTQDLRVLLPQFSEGITLIAKGELAKELGVGLQVDRMSFRLRLQKTLLHRGHSSDGHTYCLRHNLPQEIWRQRDGHWVLMRGRHRPSTRRWRLLSKLTPSVNQAPRLNASVCWRRASALPNNGLGTLLNAVSVGRTSDLLPGKDQG